MIIRQGDVVQVSGSLTIDTVPSLVDELGKVITEGANRVDLAGVEDVDSSAVALLLEWQRQAAARGAMLNWSGLPDAILNLASLYGVQDLIGGVR